MAEPMPKPKSKSHEAILMWPVTVKLVSFGPLWRLLGHVLAVFSETNVSQITQRALPLEGTPCLRKITRPLRACGPLDCGVPPENSNVANLNYNFETWVGLLYINERPEIIVILVILR